MRTDSNGDRDPDYAVQTMWGGKFTDFAEYIYSRRQMIRKAGVVVLFPGGSTQPPADHPPCGWENELCQSESCKFRTVRMMQMNSYSLIFEVDAQKLRDRYCCDASYYRLYAVAD